MGIAQQNDRNQRVYCNIDIIIYYVCTRYSFLSFSILFRRRLSIIINTRVNTSSVCFAAAFSAAAHSFAAAAAHLFRLSLTKINSSCSFSSSSSLAIVSALSSFLSLPKASSRPSNSKALLFPTSRSTRSMVPVFYNPYSGRAD